MANDESYLDEAPLTPLGMEFIDTTDRNNPARFRVDEDAGEVDIVMSDRFSYFSVHLTPVLARGLAACLNRLADKIESETTE